MPEKSKTGDARSRKTKPDATKPPTQKQVAEAAGVSQMSVALVLGHSAKHPGAEKRVSEETRQRIIKEANRLGYRPFRQAQILRGARSGTIGMIKALSNHEVNVKMAREVGLTVDRAGYKLLTAEVVSSFEDFERDLNAMLDERVEGLILQGSAAAGINAHPRLLSPIRKAGIPVIVMSGPFTRHISCFSPDFRQGVHDLVQHFVGLGCKRLTHVSFLAEGAEQSPDPMQWIDHQCLEGFRASAREMNIRPQDTEVLYFSNAAGQSDLELGYAAGSELARRNKLPDALLCRNDLMATGLLAALHHAGVKVPDDVRVAGFDNTDIGRFAPIPITSVGYPVNELARESLKHLLDLMHGDTRKCLHKSFPCTLIPRKSSE